MYNKHSFELAFVYFSLSVPMHINFLITHSARFCIIMATIVVTMSFILDLNNYNFKLVIVIFFLCIEMNKKSQILTHGS